MSGNPTGKEEEQMINLLQPPCQSLQARNTPEDQKITVKVCGYWLPPIQVKKPKKQVSRNVLRMRID